MSLVEGDIHGKPERFSSDLFIEGKELTKDDYVIILGDVGLVWDYQGENKNEKYWLDWLNNKPWTTLFIDGNHENHDRLKTYPVSEWHGGKVHFIRPNVIHLMRGQIFIIENQKFFTMGGAPSHDIQDGILDPSDPNFKETYKKWSRDPYKMFRVLGVSWWPGEIPSKDEWKEGYKNLDKVNWKVDYVLTHEAPASDVSFLSIFPPTEMSIELERIRWDLNYKHWFFGHYHLDRRINDKEEVFYETIRRIL